MPASSRWWMMPPASSARCSAADRGFPRVPLRLIFGSETTISRPATLPPDFKTIFREGSVMTDPNGPKDYQDKPASQAEPVISKPYIMPDDPETGSVEALTREAAEARDKMLRTLA